MATVEELKIRLTAQNDASKIVKQLNSDVARLANTAKNSASTLANANAKMTTGFSGMGRSAGQAGMQVQQLVGQIQGGTNPMLALSQQAADLGFVLGAPLAGAVAGIGASIAMVLLPNLFASSQAVDDLRDDISELTDEFEEATEAQKAFASDQAQRQIRKLKDSLAEASSTLSDLDYKIDRDTKLIKQFGETGSTAAIAASENLKKNKEEYLRLSAEIDTTNQKIAKLSQDLDFYNGTAERSAEKTKKLKDNFLDLKSSLVDQINTFGMTSTQIKRYEVYTSDYDETQRAALLNLLDHIEAQKQQAELFKQNSEGVRSLADGFNAYAESIGTVGEEGGKAAQKGLKKLEDSLVDLGMGAKSFQEVFKDMAKSVISDIMRIYIRQQLLGHIGGIGGGGGIGNLFGSIFGQSFNTSTVNTADGATLYNPNLDTFAGGGYTGSGARSGGVDGKGGFPAILHPNETVIDHTAGQSGGVVVNQTINISTGVVQTVRTEIASLMPQIADAAKGAVLDARRRGGSFAKGFGV